MRKNIYQHIPEIVASLFILLFTYTAMTKLLSFDTFKSQLSKSPLFSNINVVPAILIPAAEIIISVLLLIPTTRLKGLYASLGLMVVFTGYLGYMVLFTPDLPCSCGGVLKQMTWNQHIIFNGVCILLSIAAIGLSTPNKFFIAINRRSQKPV